MKCLVLGGDGFIGSYICEHLLLHGHQVIVYERSKPALHNLNHIQDRLCIIQGDFRTEANFSAVLTGIDWVFHLICTTLPANENSIIDIEDNVKPTLRFLEACKSGNVRKIIFLSSGGTIYGLSDRGCISESHPTEPICPYGVQKLTIERYLHLYRHLYGLEYAIMRVSNPYGERQDPFRPQGVIAAFIARALLDRPIEIWGDGSVVRDFLYVGDVAKAAVLLAEYNGQEKIFNIGSGVGHSLNEVIHYIAKLSEKKIKKVYFPGRSQDVPVNILDISKAKNILGWQPEVDLIVGIEKLLQAWTHRMKRFADI